MNENNDYIKITIVLIVGISVGFLLALFFTSGFRNNIENQKEYEPNQEVIDLSVNIDDLKDLIMLQSGCELGDQVACDNLDKIIKNNEDYKHLWVTPTGQIIYP